MTTIDEDLTVALHRLYPEGESDGVAIDVWERYRAGEAGTPGGRRDLAGGGGILSFLPWIGGAVAVALLAAGAGVMGVFTPGLPDAAAETPAGISTLARGGVSGSDCPGGEIVGGLATGDRVLALQRTGDDGWILVRDPRWGLTMWVPTPYLLADGGDLASLPIGGCFAAAIPEPEVAVPGPVETAEPEAGSGDPVAPTPDTTAPTLDNPVLAYSPAQGFVCTENPSSVALIQVTARDDRGVVGVTATWNGSDAGSAPMTAGSTYALAFRPDNLSITETITVTMVARDAAGNTSAPVQVVVQRDQCPG